MDIKEFKKTCSETFKKHGFCKHGGHYYYDFGNDIIFVCSLQKGYTDYYYINCGFCVKSINQYIIPYPKEIYADIRCDRFGFDNGNGIEVDSFEYEKMEKGDVINAIELGISEHFDKGKNGKEKIKEYYIDSCRCDTIVKKSTAEYFNITDPKFTILNWG